MVSIRAWCFGQPGLIPADEVPQLPVAADLAGPGVVDHHLARPRGLEDVGVAPVQCGEVLPDRISLARGAGLLARQLHGADEIRKPRHRNTTLPHAAGTPCGLPSIVHRRPAVSQAAGQRRALHSSQRTTIRLPGDAGQRQGLDLGGDRFAFRGRQPPPGLHRHHRAGAPPGPGDLSARSGGRRARRAASRARRGGRGPGPAARGRLRRGGSRRHRSAAAVRVPRARERRGTPPRQRRGSTRRRSVSAPASATSPSVSNAEAADRRPIPAHWRKAPDVAGP